MRVEGRPDGRQGCGVAVFALERLAHRVTLLENYQVAERSWVILHSDHGLSVIGCWYRPPAPRSRGHPTLVALAGSWLQQRAAQVVVDRQRSAKMLLKNMVFQGNVLGSTLWNLFYEDARRAIHEAGFVEIVYADVTNGFKEFEHNASADSTIAEAKKCQSDLHNRG